MRSSPRACTLVLFITKATIHRDFDVKMNTRGWAKWALSLRMSWQLNHFPTFGINSCFPTEQATLLCSFATALHTSYTRLVEYSILHQNCASTCSMCACDVNKCSLLLCIHSNRLGSTCMLLSLSTTETFERCKHCILPYILGL